MSDRLRRGILILDYGSQFTLLIARRIREAGVYCEIWPCNDPRIEAAHDGGAPAMGIVLSGGPSSVHVDGAPDLKSAILDLNVPVLGICYGMQLIADAFGATVQPGHVGEYGRTNITIERTEGILAGFPPGAELAVWMSHGDLVAAVPPGFKGLATSENGVLAAIAHGSRPIHAVQFHPEVAHTDRGAEILGAFVFGLSGCSPDWNMGDFLQDSVDHIRRKVGDDRVICGLSGGVDSSVVAALLARAIGRQVTCIFVDTGLLRLQERELVERTFRGHFDVGLAIETFKKFSRSRPRL